MADAQDLYQQTFLKALETEWTLDWKKNPKALFFSLAHNLWKSHRRKQARRNTIVPCINFDDETETILHPDESIEESYLQKELLTEVRQIIQTLPERFQVPLTLFYLSDLVATPFIGLLTYFLRRLEIKTICPACGQKISIKAKYCEACGTHIEKEENCVMEKQETHHLKFIIAGIVSMVLMLCVDVTDDTLQTACTMILHGLHDFNNICPVS